MPTGLKYYEAFRYKSIWNYIKKKAKWNFIWL